MGTFVDIQAPIGAQPENDDVRLYSPIALNVGDCVVIDETKTAPDGTSAATVATTLGFPTAVKAAATADLTNGAIACWALESVAAGAVGRFRIAGICQVRLAANLSANTVRNLSVTDAAQTMTQSASGQKVVAKAFTAVAVTAATNPLCNAWVDGRAGFGGSM